MQIRALEQFLLYNTLSVLRPLNNSQATERGTSCALSISFLIATSYRFTILMMDEEPQPHLGLRTAVTFTINKLPEVSQPTNVMRITGSVGGTDYATVLNNGFVVFNTGDERKPTLHSMKNPAKVTAVLDARNVLFSVALSPKIVAGLDSREVLRIWDVSTAKLLSEIELPIAAGRPSALTAIDNRIVVGYTCGAMLFLSHSSDCCELQVAKVLRAANGGGVSALAAYTGTLIVASDRIVSVWSTNSGMMRCVARLVHETKVVAVDVNEELLVTGTMREIRIYSNSPGYRALKLIRCGRDTFPPRRMKLRLISGGYLMLCGGYHDEASLAFLCLESGHVSARIRTCLSCQKDFDITPDAKVLVSSAVEGEGLAIVEINLPLQVHRALKMHAKNRFGKSRLRTAFIVASAIASLLGVVKSINE